MAAGSGSPPNSRSKKAITSRSDVTSSRVTEKSIRKADVLSGERP
jgi:hypothetical protein